MDERTDAELLAASAHDAAALRTRLAAALETLDAGQRQAVQLRVVEDRSYAEIASVLGCSEGAARVRVHRALRRLARHLEAP